MKKKKDTLLLLFCMFLFGTIGIFRRNIAFPSSVLAFGRGLLGGIFLVLLCFFKKKSFRSIPKKQFFLLLLTGGIIGLNWLVLFEAYQYTTVPTATLCYYMQPTFLIFLSPVFLKEKQNAKKLICAFISLCGMVFISGITENSIGQNAKGIILALIAALMYTVVVILNKKMTVEDAEIRTSVQLLSASAVMIPYMLLTGDLNGMQFDVKSLILTMIVGILHTGIGYAVYFNVIQKVETATVAVLSYFDPVVSLILSALLLSEPLTLFGWLGAVLIVGSAVYSECSSILPLRTKRKAKQKDET